MTKPIFSFGTSRGGTTFFARMLSVHPDIKVASDPFLPLFREFRNQLMKTMVNPNFDGSKPLDDFYYGKEKTQILDKIQSASFDLELIPIVKEQLKVSIAKRMDLAAKELVPIASRIEGDSFKSFLENSLKLMAEVYQVEEDAWVGSNDNWVVEFIPHLARAFPEAKFIIVLRDPRASMASSLKAREKNSELIPLMYSFARHWRKHAAFTKKFSLDPALQGRVFVLKYEGMVTSPQETTQKLCDFLKKSYDPRMIDPGYFRPITGDKWAAYSHFNISGDKIYTDSIDMWKKYLDPRTIEFIEFVCGPEMLMWGYDLFTYKGGLSPHSLEFMKEDDRLAKGWRGEYLTWEEEYGHELQRRSILDAPRALPLDIIRSNFLFNEVYQACHLKDLV